ncbi:MAG: 30S processome protein Utp24 [Crenarchaeota archaeon]|nr:30S processome protein Utp24 [Thermoproteota archaeon]
MEARRLGHRERLRYFVPDTSILLLIYEGVDVFTEVEELLETRPVCILLTPVLRELERLASSAKPFRRRAAARLALQVVRRRCRVVDYPGELADDAIVEYVRANPEAIAATADMGLRRRLMELGIPTIYYREERHGLEAEV